MKVKVINASRNDWYRGCIGKIFDVEIINSIYFYIENNKVVDLKMFFNKDDVEIVEDDNLFNILVINSSKKDYWYADHVGKFFKCEKTSNSEFPFKVPDEDKYFGNNDIQIWSKEPTTFDRIVSLANHNNLKFEIFDSEKQFKNWMDKTSGHWLNYDFLGYINGNKVIKIVSSKFLTNNVTYSLFVLLRELEKYINLMPEQQKITIDTVGTNVNQTSLVPKSELEVLLDYLKTSPPTLEKSVVGQLIVNRLKELLAPKVTKTEERENEGSVDKPLFSDYYIDKALKLYSFAYSIKEDDNVIRTYCLDSSDPHSHIYITKNRNLIK